MTLNSPRASIASINVVNNIFQEFHSSQNGGVISIESNEICLDTISNIYNKCTTSGQTKGGCIYFTSNGKFTMLKSCANECRSHFGYCYYILGISEGSQADTELNETSTFDCSGTEESVCGHYYCNLLSSTYNTSYCSSNTKWCNVQTWYNDRTYGKFYQFYKNRLNILFGACSKTVNHVLDYAVFISNHYSTGMSGYIHTNFFDSQRLYARNIYAFQNTGTLISCKRGMIIIESLTCDSFTTDSISIDPCNVTVNPDFSPFFIFDTDTYLCNQNLEKSCYTLKAKNTRKFLIYSSLFILFSCN